jgi:hypothetical protein
MRNAMKQFKKLVHQLISLGLLPLAHMLAFILAKERGIDLEPFFRIFYRYGFYFLRKHYYLPIPDEDDLRHVRNSELIGIAMNDEFQLHFTNDVILKYKSEFLFFPTDLSSNSQQYHLVNGTFMAGDGNAYYALIRHLKPKMIIEVGAGNSTLLANRAIEKNIDELPGYKCKFIAIELYPGNNLMTLSQLSDLKKCQLEDVALDYFNQLEADDILFIDSSHVLKVGGDVWLEYCEIIPRLKSGVYIHIHDISLPKPYPTVYYNAHWYWNEQYLLQALLINNDKLEVIWAGTYLFQKYADKMKEIFSPEYDLMRKVYPLAEPSSFWFKVK